MKKATAVIGLNYGDEGKGLVTSTLAHNHDIVVRHNGGCQAAHTVVYNGVRHVFSHFGSGTLQGLPTYLSKYFIVNPIMFRKEYKELQSKGVTPIVYMDTNAMVTTPGDMLLNQALEQARGLNRHGSCGLGINETIDRCNEHCYTSVYSTIEDLHDAVYYSLNKARYNGVLTEELYSSMFEVIDHYIDDFLWMLSKVEIVNDSILHEYDNVLFEGAQGLMLDEYFGEFPHVTRSRTGTANVHSVLCDLGKFDLTLNVYYVTRHYATRHGAGPFNELPMPDWVVDPTNKPNEWQGTLRFGNLDFDSITRVLSLDRHRSSKNNLVITCMDQHADYNGEPIWGRCCNKLTYLKIMQDLCRMPIQYTESPETQLELKSMQGA